MNKPSLVLYEHVAKVSKAVASPKRLQLVDLLCQGEKTVDVLAKSIGISVKLASAHLQDLKAASLVESRRDGKFIWYRIADREVAVFWVSLRTLAERRLAAIEDVVGAYLKDRETLSPIDRKSLVEKARRGDVVVIDVRPRDEFEAGHFPGARSMPLGELRKALSSLPKNKAIVAYCRGPYCVLAGEAVTLLRKRGFRATRLAEGVSEWVAAGMAIAQNQQPDGKREST